jgi:exodeoxyribonuclease V beta subunit
MTTTAKPSLDALRFPLRGSQLIEASAGTGKTYTIAALYVRLVLGPIDAADTLAFSRPLLPPEILVVTFTEAATQELRDRIRQRLTQAAEAFLQLIEPTDRFLQDMLAAYAPALWPGCARRLQTAAEWMDEAAVSTIHGWCRRMLREHAFDSGALFSQRLEPDLSDLRQEAAQDYWRSCMVPLSAPMAPLVRRWYRGPAELEPAVQGLLDSAELLPQTAEPEVFLQQRLDSLQALKAPWPAWTQQLQQALDDARERKAFNGQKLNQRNYNSWLNQLRAWAADPLQEEPDLSEAAKARLSAQGMQEAWKSGTPLDHPAFTALAELPARIAALPGGESDLLCHAARWIAQRFEQAQRQRGLMGFSGLLSQLDAALQSDKAQALAQRIRAQFPVALIDEFQDTDPVQYRIFDAVYQLQRGPEESADSALILIGDPKQAIYSFRGADIYTYLQARRATAGRWHSLAQNFRSTEAMLQAVNACFMAAEQRQTGQGAFLFRDVQGHVQGHVQDHSQGQGQGQAQNNNPVPFTPAEATNRSGSLQVCGQQPPALSFWSLPLPDGGKAMNKDDARSTLAEVFATEITRLLNLAQQGQALILSANGQRPLQPADMAVLVNGWDEARAMQQALSARGVRSVYLSERDSVYASAQAADLQHWLAAVAEPENASLIRAALATATLGLSWAQLDALRHEDLAWEAEVSRFQQYRLIWQRQGVLPMLRRLLHDFRLPQRLAAAEHEGGERALTNLLHLAELLQQAAQLYPAQQALLRFLAEQRAEGKGAAGADDPRQLRLESDAERVQLVTVHKSKGLQYPLVFLPFANAARPLKHPRSELRFLSVHDADGQPRICIPPSPACLQQAEAERLGEDLRKLYVALTRARYATYCGVAPTQHSAESALAYLVGASGEELDLQPYLQQLAQEHADCITACHAPEANPDRFTQTESLSHAPALRSIQRQISENWWIASYSAISGQADSLGSDNADGPALSETARESNFLEAQAEWGRAEWVQAKDAVQAKPEPNRLHAFPKGAEAGTFLHDQLEWAARRGFAQVQRHEQERREHLSRRCAVRDWNHWVEPLCAWLGDFLAAELRLPGEAFDTTLRLADIHNATAELEFWLAASAVPVERIDVLVRQHILPGQARPALKPTQINGMLKGFIDLCFQWQGRFFIADYKSNWLGPNDAAYSAEAMQQAMLAHRYDLQYVLYSLALHRLLKARQPAYDYDKHLGGALYFFLRGLKADSQGLYFDRPPRALIESLDQAFAGQDRAW